MAIKSTCLNCGRTVKARDHMAGKRVRCPRCHGPVQMPLAAPRRLDQVALAAEPTPPPGREPTPSGPVAESPLRQWRTQREHLRTKVQEAVRLHRSQDYHRAADAWREAYRTQPASMAYAYNLAVCWWRTDRPVEAVHVLLPMQEAMLTGRAGLEQPGRGQHAELRRMVEQAEPVVPHEALGAGQVGGQPVYLDPSCWLRWLVPGLVTAMIDQGSLPPSPFQEAYLNAQAKRRVDEPARALEAFRAATRMLRAPAAAAGAVRAPRWAAQCPRLEQRRPDAQDRKTPCYLCGATMARRSLEIDVRWISQLRPTGGPAGTSELVWSQMEEQVRLCGHCEPSYRGVNDRANAYRNFAHAFRRARLARWLYVPGAALALGSLGAGTLLGMWVAGVAGLMGAGALSAVPELIKRVEHRAFAARQIVRFHQRHPERIELFIESDLVHHVMEPIYWYLVSHDTVYFQDLAHTHSDRLQVTTTSL